MAIFLCKIFLLYILFPLSQLENVLIADDGNHVLCDFGSATARVLDTEQHNVKQIEEEIQK